VKLKSAPIKYTLTLLTALLLVPLAAPDAKNRALSIHAASAVKITSLEVNEVKS